MLRKINRVLRQEGVYGLAHRVLVKFFILRAIIGKIVGRKEVRSRYGIKISENAGDATYHHYVSGGYGFYYWNRLSRISSKFIFLDIGANQGLYTICAALNPNSERCIAFEPVSDTFRLLERNVLINGVAKKCDLINKAISDKVGESDIKVTIGHSGAATLAELSSYDNSSCQRIAIETIDGDALWQIIGRIHIPIYVKIDVEGFEMPVIRQLLNSGQSGAIKEIYYEVNEKWVSPEEIKAVLAAYGFRNFHKIRDGLHYDVLAER